MDTNKVDKTTSLLAYVFTAHTVHPISKYKFGDEYTEVRNKEVPTDGAINIFV